MLFVERRENVTFIHHAWGKWKNEAIVGWIPKWGYIVRVLSPGVDFTNILHSAFMCVDPKSTKKAVKSSVMLRF